LIVCLLTAVGQLCNSHFTIKMAAFDLSLGVSANSETTPVGNLQTPWYSMFPWFRKLPLTKHVCY